MSDPPTPLPNPRSQKKIRHVCYQAQLMDEFVPLIKSILLMSCLLWIFTVISGAKFAFSEDLEEKFGF